MNISIHSTAPKVPLLRKDGVLVWLVLLILAALFFFRNITGLIPAIPFDLLYQYYPWRNEAVSTQSIHNPELTDQVLQFYPWNRLATEELKHGRFPLWNPFSFCGSPLFANGQSGILYPLNLLNLIFGPLTASVLLECARLLIAGIFSWAFLRQLGLCRSASIFGAVAFAFSRNMIVWLGFPAADVAILLPALFWAVERLIKRPNAIHALAGALLVAVQFLAGQPQTSLVCFFGVTVYLVVRLCSRNHSWNSRFRIGGLYTGWWLLGTGLSAIQIIPLLEYIKESAAFFFRSQTNLKTYPWHELVSFIVPDFYGTPYDGNYWGFANLIGTACYFGIGPLILALMSLPRIFSRAKLGAFWLLALFSLGIIYRIPGIDGILRLPLFNAIDTNKFLVLIVFALAVCSSLELDRIVRNEEPRFFAKGMTVFVAIFLFALLTLYALRAFVSSLSLQSYEIRNFVILLVLGILCLVIFFLHSRGILGREGFCWALLAITSADLYWFGHIYNAAAVRQEMPGTPSAILQLPEDANQYRVLGIKNVLPPNTSILYGLADVRGYDAMTPRRYFDFLSRSQAGYADFYRTLGLGDSNSGESPITRSTLFLRDIRHRLESPDSNLRELLRKAFYWNTNLDSLVQSDALGFFSIQYVLAPPGIKELPGGKLRYIGGKEISVFENPDRLPRCFLRRDFEFADEENALRIASQPDFDFKKRLLLSGVSNKESMRRLFDGRKKDPEFGEDTKIVHQTHVEVAARISAPAIVVLNDLFAVGWEAYIDGERAEIYQANYLFRAVTVQKAGAHKVEFYYRPAGFKWGTVITLSSLLFFCIALGIYFLNKGKYSDNNNSSGITDA